MELKHIAPYLPYGLKCKYADSPTIWEIDIFAHKINHDDDKLPIYHLIRQDEGVTTCKPILRPLSDLTKPIEHNGERFVPLEIIVAIALKEMDIKESDAVILSRMIMYNDNIHKIPFWCIQKLIEWKFDIFNLIEKGEAIDVNTLEANPYK